MTLEERHALGIHRRQPDKPDPLYLAIRCLSDERQKDQASVEAHRRFPEHFWLGWGAAQARWRQTVHIERHISSTVESTIIRTGTDSFRDGFWISGDCGLVGSGFLPAPRELTAKSSGWYNFGHVLSSNMWRDGWNSWTTCRGTANAGQDSDWYWYDTDWREDGVGSGDNHVVTSAAYSPP